MENLINRAMTFRLVKYLRVLKKLKSFGFGRIYSNNLGDAIGVSPSIVRKDFSLIDITGNKRGGYNISSLIDRLNHILGMDQEREVIIVGCGRIGVALIEYREFVREGINIIAGFDIDPESVSVENDIPILHVNRMKEFIAEKGIQVGIITVPDNAATTVFDQMYTAGIRGFLNFTSVELKGPTGAIIQSVNIGIEIENLFYLVNNADRDFNINRKNGE